MLISIKLNCFLRFLTRLLQNIAKIATIIHITTINNPRMITNHRLKWELSKNRIYYMYVFELLELVKPDTKLESGSNFNFKIEALLRPFAFELNTSSITNEELCSKLFITKVGPPASVRFDNNFSWFMSYIWRWNACGRPPS